MKGSRKYRLIMAELDKAGIIVAIVRIEKKQFDFIVNFRLIKSFKKRDSCNQRLIKLYDENRIK